MAAPAPPVTPATLDTKMLQASTGKAVGEIGAAVCAALVVIGDRLGLCNALTESGRPTSHEPVAMTGTDERCAVSGRPAKTPA